jgi:hypothetical protein
MNVHLFVKYEDIEKYNNGEEIIATDLSGKSTIFKFNDIVLPVSVPSTEIIEKQEVVTTGFSKGTFNKYIIKRLH